MAWLEQVARPKVRPRTYSRYRQVVEQYLREHGAPDERAEAALGEAVVTLSKGSKVVVGRAVALDVIEAAAYAYVNALNWLVRQQQDMAGATPGDQQRR